MEMIKISVEVNVNLSEQTQKFITGLFGGVKAVEAPAQKPAPAPAPAPAQKPAPAPTPAPASASSISIEDVRKALSEKVNDHRETIKQKLNELGAPSVTKLDPSKYDEMYQFLKAL